MGHMGARRTRRCCGSKVEFSARGSGFISRGLDIFKGSWRLLLEAGLWKLMLLREVWGLKHQAKLWKQMSLQGHWVLECPGDALLRALETQFAASAVDTEVTERTLEIDPAVTF